jgi:hypothetical protein
MYWGAVARKRTPAIEPDEKTTNNLLRIPGLVQPNQQLQGHRHLIGYKQDQENGASWLLRGNLARKKEAIGKKPGNAP